MTTENVINFGTAVQRHVKREFGGHMAIFVQPRCKPKMLAPGLNDWFLGLHFRQWYNQVPRTVSGTGYYVRVVPMYSYWSDPDGLPLMGTPTTVSATGSVFDFKSFPDGYPCTGYRVYAGTDTTTLYYQGELAGRFNCTFDLAATWGGYVGSGDTLSAQSSGPIAFGDALEVYQVEGATDSRVLLGGGKSYMDGYARVLSASAAPYLTAGTAAESDYTVWAAITDGSFRMRLAWSEGSKDHDSYFDFTGIDFTGDASMANVASTIQTDIQAAKGPELFCGTGYEDDITVWNAVTDGSFAVWVDNAVVNVTGCDFSADNNMGDVATTIQTAWRSASGGSTETVTWDATATKLIFKVNPASPTYVNTLSYLERHTAGTGTDISEYCDGRSESATAVLNRYGKASSSETVAWSTDHFVITGASSGAQYRVSYLAQASGNVGTDISVAAYLDARSNSQMATYTPGATAKRTVVGTGTSWGEWAVGMRFRIQDESDETLIADVYDTDCILLDADYSGDALGATPLAYILQPYDSQVYPSALGNPFKWDSPIPLPTADSDKITCIKRLGRNFAIFMQHHIWIVDGVNITAPRQISQQYGAPNSDCVIEYSEGLAFFTGQEFMFLTGGSIKPLDPEGRIRELLSRKSVNTSHIHGQYIYDGRTDVCIWWMGLDSSYKYGTAIVCDMKSGNFWLYNHKDANCSAVIRDRNDTPYLVTGSTKDDGHSTKGLTFIHGFDYKNDGASWDSTKTKQGIINAVGTATTTAGRLDCGAFGNTVANLIAVTEGYFTVTIDDTTYDVGPIDFSTGSDADGCAALIQTAIRAKTSAVETCTYETDHFRITSGTTTNRSNISYLQPYIPNSTATNIAGKNYLNGEDGAGTKTDAVTQVVLTLDDMDNATAALSVSGDGEIGCYVYVCDTEGKNGQYALVAANDATTITVTPNFGTTPAAGWYWFLGGIVPTYTKWFDWNSPHNRSKLHGVILTLDPSEAAAGNKLFMLGMQDLSTTIRESVTLALGGTQDSTNTLHLADQPANQHGITIKRPNSVQGFQLEDITLVHAPRT